MNKSDDWKIEKTFQWNIFLKFKKLIFVFWESSNTHTPPPHPPPTDLHPSSTRFYVWDTGKLLILSSIS